MSKLFRVRLRCPGLFPVNILLVLVVERLYQHAHEYSNLANRAGPIVTDLMLACRDINLQPKALYQAGVKNSKKRKKGATF